MQTHVSWQYGREVVKRNGQYKLMSYGNMVEKV